MSLNRTRFWYEGTGIVQFDLYGGFVIDFPTGAAELASNLDTVRNPDGIGVSIQQMSTPERLVTINGYIMGLPADVYRRQLERAFAPTSAGKLWAETDAHEFFYLDCVSSAAPVIAGNRKYPRFQSTLTACYPYWQRDGTKEIQLRQAAGTGQFNVAVLSDAPALFRAEFSAGSAGSTVALCIGDTELRYAGAIAAGQLLVVSVDAAGRVAATLDGADVIGNVSGGLKKLPPGQQLLRVEAPPGTMKITYREARAGV